MRLIKKELKKGQSAIVFAQYVHSVKKIVERAEKEEGLKPVVFIGQRKGNSQKNQKEILDKFREGEFNVLCCTSIGEEGLDIPTVDLVVFYEAVPSEIRAIQRRGRTGRSRAGNVYMLMTKGTIDEAYYWTSKHKERKMHGVLGSLKSSMKSEGVTIKEKPQKSLDSYKDEKIMIYVDHRERKIIKKLSEKNVMIETGQLEVGDFIISDRVGVERKEVGDFLNSMMDKRLFTQMTNLKDNFLSPLLIIEGKNLFG